MSKAEIYRTLAWLPRTPADFRARLKALDVSSPRLGTTIRGLASYGHDLDDLTRIARLVEAGRSQAHDLTPLIPFRLGLIGDGTLDFLKPALIGTAARSGFALDVVTSEYGQVLQSAASPTSAINRAKPDAVLLSLDYRALPLKSSPGNVEAADASVETTLGYIEAVREALRANSGAMIIVPTLATPPEALFGSFDRAVPGAMRNLLERVNQGIVARVGESPDLLLDVASIAETVGLADWYDPYQWNLAKLPFAEEYIPLYADHVVRLIAAMRGRSRRVLVLDLDNTLWGGVIGDDGLGGILLAQGDAAGEAHLAVQRLALDLRSRGVVLAVCSKNTDAVAREVFKVHPEMLLREEHIAVFQANWTDKATNIKAIASELSLGLESMVFLDDNPVERDFIRQTLPEVAVVEVGADPSDYARLLAASGHFELTTFSDEDRGRANFYQMNAQRSTLKTQSGDLKSYLASLGMEIIFSPFDAMGRARIAQLISKSNQFNLTTRRYSELEVQAIEQDPTCFTLQVRLTDTFGDNGMISVIICRDRLNGECEIDTWLMSCRVLGRGVEQMVLREIIRLARGRGLNELQGRYLPTTRNELVKDHYAKLGFELQFEGEAGETHWRLSTEAEVPSAPMAVQRIGFLTTLRN